ncbi:N-acetylmuramoyl-L-alanine amidase [Paenibacillus phyllosphaerae]|uniref:N-acetylmuramoyl-L-alanine amidase n=1 Tax=Paenibacillus phyllosphaerae TaxID=274593 RepID=A0A7W5FQA9_9BACL|nr:cell wall hydrolase [Paenibacillus phyllosphaerae]MBB3113098.1 N-acetylmuramoyl-L-alanine amidase [Paenibacillus phyllosphaerae]
MGARVRYTSSDVDLLARLMRGEAQAEGEKGMLTVGAVVINRAVVRCSDFKNVNNINDVIYHYMNGDAMFDAILEPDFYQKSRERERRLAEQTIKGWREWPSKYSLWYFNPWGPTSQACPAMWYGQPLAGTWKNHCFYQPTSAECAEIYR